MADPTGEFADLLSYHVVEGQLGPDERASTRRSSYVIDEVLHPPG